MNWRRFSYLQDGTPRQRTAHDVLVELAVFEHLRRFDPALVSTVCIGLDVSGSDLDIICDVSGPGGPADFRSTVERLYGHQPQFQMWTRAGGAVVARFDTAPFPVELFGKQQPVERQAAWRHLSVMKRLVEAAPQLREEVRHLKREGLGTEPAFAHLLGLDGDPYEAMLSLETATEKEIGDLCARAA